ncbi:hypothetical protein GBF38_010232, partial [Nibea albiflora]
SRSVQGEDIGIQICGCYCEQMSPLVSKGNGTSRPTLTPGAKQHTTTGLQRGQEAGGTASTRRSPLTPLPRTGRISPDEHSHFLLLLTAPDRYENTDQCICGGSDVE